MLKIFKDALFGLAYVMTEGVDQDTSTFALRRDLCILLIDAVQVLRTMVGCQYGWTEDSAFVITRIDVVNLLLELIQNVVSRWILYMLCAIIVIICLADAFYVAKLFLEGQVKKLWPVKVLRFLVTSFVTTLFPTVVEFLLYPVDCCLEPDMTLSAQFSSSPDPVCNPWGLPELAATLPTLGLVVCFVGFAITITLLSFEINPLSRSPLATCTGRVEALYTLFKVAVSLLAFLSVAIPPVISTVIVAIFAVTVFVAHYTIMPFHVQEANVVRGGVLSAISWFSVATFVATFTGSQSVQWVLICLVPAAFIGGCYMIDRRSKEMQHLIAVLRGEQEELKGGGYAIHTHSPPPTRGVPVKANSFMSRRSSIMSKASVAPVKRSVYDKFFDLNAEKRLAFKSSLEAFAVLRTLLHQRDENDLPLLRRLMIRALQEHPESEACLMFQLMMLRFVYRDTTAAAAQEKLAKLTNNAMALDRSYMLYAVDRKSIQENAGQTLGTGNNLTALNLMEHDAKMAIARKAHQDCLTHLKAFWRLAFKHNRKHKVQSHANQASQVNDMISRLYEFEKAAAHAKMEYMWLLEKFPASVSILSSYASFCDIVLNDFKEAEAKRTQAALLEDPLSGDDGSEGNVDNKIKGPKPKMSSGQSATTSESEGSRIQIERQATTWGIYIMGSEVKALDSLKTRVRFSVLLLAVVSTIGWAVMDFSLFSNVAIHNIDLIASAGWFREDAVTATFNIRSMSLSAWTNNSAGVTALRQENEMMSHELLAQHRENFETANSGKAKHFYEDPDKTIRIPGGNGWQTRTMSFWTLGTDFARRFLLASETPVDQLAHSDYTLEHAEEPKRNVLYLTENLYSYLLPEFDRLVDLFEDEVFAFGKFTRTICIVTVAINSALVVGIAVSVLRALGKTIYVVQAKYAACVFALALPPKILKKLYNFYGKAERTLKYLEDEDLERKELLDEDGEKDGQSGEEEASAKLGQKETLPFAAEREDEAGSPMLSRYQLKKLQSELSDGESDQHSEEGSHDHDVQVQSAISEALMPTVNSEVVLQPLTTKNMEKYLQLQNTAPLKTLNNLDSASSPRGQSSLFSPQPLSPTTPKTFQQHNSFSSPKGSPKGSNKGHGSLLTPQVALTGRIQGAGPGAKWTDALSPLSLPGGEGPQKPIREEDGSLSSSSSSLQDQINALVDGTVPKGISSPLGKVSKVVVSRWIKVVKGLVQQDRQKKRRQILKRRSIGGTRSDGNSSKVAKESKPGGSPVAPQPNFGEVPEAHADISQDDETGLNVEPVANSKEVDPERTAESPGNSEAPSSAFIAQLQRPTGIADAVEDDDTRSDAGLSVGSASQPSADITDVIDIQPDVYDVGVAGSNFGFKEEEFEITEVLPLGAPTRPRTSFSGGQFGSESQDPELSERSLSAVEAAKAEETSEHSQVKFPLKSSFKRPSISWNSDQNQETPVLELTKPASPPPNSPKRASFFNGGSFKNLGGSLKDVMSMATGKPDLKRVNSIGTEDEDKLDLIEVKPDAHAEMHKALQAHHPWFNSWWIYTIVLAIMLGLCLFSVLYPARHIDEIVNMAPSMNLADKRLMLMKASALLSRELVLDDGFSRLHNYRIAGTLNYVLKELEEVDLTIRQGGSRHVKVGADHRHNKVHNDIMYSEGCHWRNVKHMSGAHRRAGGSSATSAGGCEVPVFPKAAQQGLYPLLLLFMDTVHTILDHYGPKDTTWANAYDIPPAPEYEHDFDYLDFHPERFHLLESNPDLKFILEMFHGELFLGLHSILTVFHDETEYIFETVHSELRLLYSVYIVMVILLFYVLLFKRTMSFAYDQSQRAKSFVKSMPLYTLTVDEIDTVKKYFIPEEMWEHED